MANLAIAGGKAAIESSIGHPWPIFGAEEERKILDVLRSGNWWRGAYSENPQDSQVTQFEDAFAAYHDARHAVAVTNGTTAIECVLRALDIEAGDEVLVPAMTFVASATAIAYVGAIPVFVDIDPETYNIDPTAMEAAITDRTRAAVVVHNGGYPVDLPRVLDIARRRHIAVIEDGAHAHGTVWDGRKVGAIADAGTFSFQMGKTLTCGEGGVILTDNDQTAEKAYSVHHIGRLPGRPFYEFHRLGSNLRMTEWQGAILNAQLARLDEQIKRRDANARYLAEGMADIPGVRPIARDPRVEQWGFYYWNFHYDAAQLGGVSKQVYMKAAAAEGLPIGDGAHGRPIYNNPVFQTAERIAGRAVDFKKTWCEQAERVHREQAMRLGHRLFLGDRAEMDRILEAMRKLADNVDELRGVEV